LAAGLSIGLVVSELYLELSEVTQDVGVPSVIPEGVKVGFPGFIIVLVATMQDTIDVPASEIPEVLEQSLLDLVESLSFFLHCIQVEGLHGLSLGVVRVLFKDLLRILEGLLELFVVVEGQHLIKKVLLLLLEAISG